MSKRFRIIFLFLSCVCFSQAQTSLTTINVCGTLRIVEPSLDNIEKLVSMQYWDFTEALKSLGYEKTILSDEIYYKKGSAQDGGENFLNKDLHWVVYMWNHLGRKGSILVSLENKLETYYVGSSDKGRSYMFKDEKFVYEISIQTNDNGDRIMARRKALE